MSETIIRHYKPEDEAAVSAITYRTGFFGQDLTGREYFNDRRLFFLLFIYYYTRFEPEHFFVAEEAETRVVVGFICGTPDSGGQDRRFIRSMVWRICLRMFCVTLWRYPGTLKTILAMLKMFREIVKYDKDELYAQYPAHLHINLLPGYQGLGLGSRLIQHFEAHMIQQGATGLHLSTTNYNRKAVPFYAKHGYSIYKRTPTEHPTLVGLQELIYVKRLSHSSDGPGST